MWTEVNMSTETEQCPKCGAECCRDSVHNGVAMLYGPWGCPGCGWSEDERYDCSEGRFPDHDYPGRFVDQFGAAHSVVRVMEDTGMSIEAGVLVDHEGQPIYWHMPHDRSTVILPDSPDFWSVIWENRDRLQGFAHTHPGYGLPGPSPMDITTFAAIEAGLGRNLVWWILSFDDIIEVKWDGPNKHDYRVLNDVAERHVWAERLRDESKYEDSKTDVNGGAL